ncbi:DUF4158 domain-containing protein [Actinomadura mexicana]|uniref:DUF4158 domain-containing protein n=1 Tax=Actinomadura mexicana TaxID=134959 RepID=A0A238Z8R9_9ACTN|nr:DUF4158 domain-containing protein [Actinomadura mexicana]SNR79243.1 protein of unknown function [Actinomadura mexicana]
MDELVEHRTVLDDELEFVAGKRGATRLGFALLLKFYTRHGRVPRGRAEFADRVVDHVARQVKVPASELGLYDWTGRTIEYHRTQRVTGKENILFHIAEALLATPDDQVRDVVFPAVTGTASAADCCAPGTASIGTDVQLRPFQCRRPQSADAQTSFVLDALTWLTRPTLGMGDCCQPRPSQRIMREMKVSLP